ncbi:hypothetical protein DB347_07565 [Opitutaceae bacterium EW11]|nr:hypothetical protein DB347_07565 [Opitutaceae bacterium EW11]
MKPSSDAALSAVPEDPTQDFGPVHRGGPITRFIALTSLLMAIGTALLLLREGETLFAVLCLIVLGGIGAWSGGYVVQRLKYREKLPKTHSVLPGILGFHLRCTCRDVGPAVFLLPDTVTPGSATRLFCFVENYSSRKRVAHFRIGPHPHLGLPQVHEVALNVAPGQAAVYSLPLAVSRELPPGEHDLPVTLCVSRPNGMGVRLPGATPHFFDLHTVHYAAPLTVISGAAAAPAGPVGPDAARYLSLASVSRPKPELDALQDLVDEGPSALPRA